MISIIICSKYPVLNKTLVDNIAATINTDYELIVIDNSQNQYSIFSAYNLGFTKSKAEILCFVHEDVHFLTNKWGEILINHFSDKNVGIIGLAGGDFLSRVPTSWSASGVAKNFIQADKTDNAKKSHQFAQTKAGDIRQEVLLLDGVFLSMRRDVFEKISFDETTFSGFHAYDLDISMQAKMCGYSNYVIFDLLLEHYSHGYRSKDWVSNVFKLVKKWEDCIPLTIGSYSSSQISEIEHKQLVILLKRMLRLGYSKAETYEMLADLWTKVFPNKSLKHLSCKLNYYRILGFFNFF